jgi:TolB-like protein/tetratricopeptide (TPR) repeat protein
VVLQVVDVLGDQFDWPSALGRGVTVALAIGFVVALILASYHGEKGRQHISGPELLLIAAALGIGGLVMTLVVGGDSPDGAPSSAAADQAISGPLDPKRVAVLPFEHRSPDPGDEFFTEGIHDDLLSQLAKVQDLSVISRTSTEGYAGTTLPVPQIARELGAGTLVQGGVQRAGAAVRINVQVIDGRSDAHLWAETFDRPFTMDNLFDVQTAIVREVTNAVSATLLPEEEQRIVAPPTSNAQAYELYQQARQIWRSGIDDADQLMQAIEAYERALALDSTFALAYVGLSDAAADLAGRERADELVPLARSSALRALEIDPDLGEAHGSLAYIAHVFDWDTAAARGHFERAIELSPNNTVALHDYGRFLFNFGDLDRSIGLYERARALDPRTAYISWNLGRSLSEAGRPEEGLQAIEAGLALQRDHYPHVLAAYALFRLGRPEDAARRAELALLNAGSDSVFVLAPVAELRARAGEVEAARAALQRAKSAADTGGGDPVGIAWAHVALGEPDSAFVWFDRGLAQRSRFILERRLWSDWADPIRDDPRYVSLLRRIDLDG